MTSIGDVLPESLSCPYDEGSAGTVCCRKRLSRYHAGSSKTIDQITARRATASLSRATLAATATFSPAAKSGFEIQHPLSTRAALNGTSTRSKPQKTK
jgi:hypothetical protein